MSFEAETWRPTAPAGTPSHPGSRVEGRRAAAAVMASAPAAGNPTSPQARTRAAQRRRAMDGMPMVKDPNRRWWQRILLNPYYHLNNLLLLLFTFLAVRMYVREGRMLMQEVQEVTEQMGVPVTLKWAQFNEAMWVCTKAALGTVLVWIVVLILIDRIRPASWMMRFTAFGWGAFVATFVSAALNTYFGDLLGINGPVDAGTGARAAVFSAPFVEETAKASVLFLLAIVMRRRMMSAAQVFSLAGLSAAGFAFVENIIYYIRTYLFAANLSGEDAGALLNELANLRGVQTAFGHVLFTSCTALGLVIAITNRSKLVRIVAPLAGFGCAVLGHMTFNFFASVGMSSKIMSIVGWIAMAAVIIYVIARIVSNRRQMSARLAEFVQMGWLEPDDPEIFTSMAARFKMGFVSVLSGWKIFRATYRVRRDITELAYLREAETRGLVDAASVERQRDLIWQIETDRLWAITDPRGLAWIPQNIKDFFRSLPQRMPWRRNRDQLAQLPAPVSAQPPMVGSAR